jgi:hypothetical protein
VSFVDHLRLANRADRTILRLLNLGGWFSTGAAGLGIARVPDPAGYSMCGSRRTQRLLPSIPRAAARKIDHSDDRPCPHGKLTQPSRAHLFFVSVVHTMSAMWPGCSSPGVDIRFILSVRTLVPLLLPA